MTRRHRTGSALLVVALAAGLTACATMGGEPAPSLYKRLGGRDGIALVVGDFVAGVAADPRTAGRFRGLPGPKVEQLKSHFADQLCEASGGPCSYVGRDMKTVHTGMKITESEWNAAVDVLIKAMDKHKVGMKEQQEVIGLLIPMKPDIVGR